jgi:hypothetical protein
LPGFALNRIKYGAQAGVALYHHLESLRQNFDI